MRENGPKSRIGSPSLQICRALEGIRRSRALGDFGRIGRAGPMRAPSPPPPLREALLPTMYATIRQRYRQGSG